MTKTIYTEMVDSGIEWIGKIPKDWGVRKNKRLYEKHFGGIRGDDALSNQDDIPCVRVADFDYEKLSTIDNIETIRNISSDQKQNKILKYGDIILEKSGGGEKTPVGRAVLFNKNIDMVCANFNEVLRPKVDTSSKFLIYLHSYLYLSKINLRSIKQNTGIQNLDIYGYLSDLVPLPPLETQQSIASYLDTKTAQIDEAISLKTQQIELLREKRTALINHIVTKGLDPDVELVDSGIEWVGKIPKGWELRRLNKITKVGSSKRVFEESYRDEGIPFFRSKEVVELSKGVDTTAGLYISFDLYNDIKTAYGIPKPGDILLTSIGTIGLTRICDEREFYYKDGNITQVDGNSEIDSKFIQYCFNSRLIKDQYEMMSAGSTLLALTIEKIKQLLFVLPSLKEQQAIVSHLDTKIVEIDQTIALVQKSIDLLIEYKQSLISHVVTGKVKVG